MNNNNHNNNGKEVNKGQLPGNDQNKINPKTGNRRKKKVINTENKVHPVETKKISITVNKDPKRLYKNTPKGQVIKLEDKESKIHPVNAVISKPQQSENLSKADDKAYVDDSSTLRSTTTSTQTKDIEKENYKLSANGGRLLLVGAIVLFVTWAVIFFYYNPGGNVHMLLALAVICVIISLIGRKRR